MFLKNNVFPLFVLLYRYNLLNKKNMSIKRIYRGRDVEMLTVCDIMIDNAIADQVFLSSKRKTWTIEFFTGIKTGISSAFRLINDNKSHLPQNIPSLRLSPFLPLIRQ
ncbi:MAG TPA: hypothetical protein DEG28_05670 [Porphyromonadaceae bacterium]|nr:hypothetical protein [Porphyromonadaceae bacterium]